VSRHRRQQRRRMRKSRERVRLTRPLPPEFYDLTLALSDAFFPESVLAAQRNVFRDVAARIAKP